MGNEPRRVVILLLPQNGWKLSQLAPQDKNTTTSTQTQIIKSLAVQRLKSNELEEQWFHSFNLIRYLVPMTMSILWITSES